jgi:hypothetical protein
MWLLPSEKSEKPARKWLNGEFALSYKHLGSMQSEKLFAALLIQFEVKVASVASFPAFVELDYHGWTKNRVAGILTSAWKIQLARYYLPARFPGHLHVDMAGTPRVSTGNNRTQQIFSLLISKLVSAKLIAAVVIVPVAVRLPEIQPGVRNRIAVTIDYVAA